jgi:hypothetical protein
MIREWISDPTRITAMEQAATEFYRPNAASDIVEALSHA